MFQSKWVRIPVKILLVWLVISIYFYLQHPVVYRYQDLNANIPIGDAQLLIHEILVSNLDEDLQHDWLTEEERPWRIKLLQRMYELGLPLSWQGPANKVLSFYSWPPLAEDFWSYKIFGTYISPEDIDMEEYTLDGFSLHIYPGMSRGRGCQWEETSRNAAMIYAGGKIDPQLIDNPLIMTVADKENDRTTKLIITPRWQKERLTNRVSQIERYKSPAAPVQNFMFKIYNGQPQQALEYVLPSLRNNFPLPALSEKLKGQDIEIEGRLSWLDVWNDYLSVYQMQAEVGKPSENNFVPVQKLTFYTILDHDGNHRIIGWKSAD